MSSSSVTLMRSELEPGVMDFTLERCGKLPGSNRLQEFSLATSLCGNCLVAERAAKLCTHTWICFRPAATLACNAI